MVYFINNENVENIFTKGQEGDFYFCQKDFSEELINKYNSKCFPVFIFNECSYPKTLKEGKYDVVYLHDYDKGKVYRRTKLLNFLRNKFNISDFVNNHNFFINFKLNKYQSYSMNKIAVLDTLKSSIAKNMVSGDPKPEEITPDVIPQILQRIGNSNKFIKINLKKAYELGLVELPFIKYSFDFEKIKEDLLGFLNPVNIFNSKNTLSVFILLIKFIMDNIIFIKINTIKENLVLLNEYYDQHGTYSINYKIADSHLLIPL